MGRTYLFSRTIAGVTYNFFRTDRRLGVYVDADQQEVEVSSGVTVEDIDRAIALCNDHGGVMALHVEPILAV